MGGGGGHGRGKHLSLKMNCCNCQMFSLCTHADTHSHLCHIPFINLQVEQWWLPKHANSLTQQQFPPSQLHTPFLEEMSLASSSLRLARESGSSSATGRAFSWEAERLCRRWGSPKLWMSVSRRATRQWQDKTQSRQMSDTKTHCNINESACWSDLRRTFRGSGEGALALV